MLSANFFDGQSARPQPVRLYLHHESAGAMLEVQDQAGLALLVVPFKTVQVSEPMGRAPRTLRFSNGALCEVADLAGLRELLQATQRQESWIVRLQASWSATLLAFAGVILFIAVCYYIVLPAAAKIIAPRLPASVNRALSEGTLQSLDKSMLHPSRLSAERQTAILSTIQHFAQQNPSLPAYRIFFRSAPKVGSNAFALPNGDIVIFDELVAIARNDQDVLAVVAHELGHVKLHHGLRQLIQGTVVSLAVGAYFGDFSSVATSLSTMVLQSNYSRNFEREADQFAGRLLLHSQLGVEPLAFMLRQLEKEHSKKTGKNTDNDDRHGDNSNSDWLSSHPDTSERIQRLENMARKGLGQ